MSGGDETTMAPDPASAARNRIAVAWRVVVAVCMAVSETLAEESTGPQPRRQR